jgi:TolB protein
MEGEASPSVACNGRVFLNARGGVCLAALLAALPVSVEPARPRGYSSEIAIYDVATKKTTILHRADEVWEAPNWSHDGKFLLANSNGWLFRIPTSGGAGSPEPIALDPTLRCNNDHGFSPDGTRLAISAASASSPRSQIYVARADGSRHELIVAAAPSYFHGWSPDGKFLAFVANRDGQQYDLYRISVSGRKEDRHEERLTSDGAYDDGPDYSPDGRWIYFNSNRGGGWNIWRMPADGAGPADRRAEQITNDDLEDWFPHPSPDGTTLLFLSFPQGTPGHDDRNAAVTLRTVPLPGNDVPPARPVSIMRLTGGQGTINVDSWAPDSTRFAYVAYARRPAGRDGVR